MAHCYQCGVYLSPHEPQYRRDVYTGGSSGTSTGSRSFRVSSRSHHGVRTLCAGCAHSHDIWSNIKLAFGALIAIAFLSYAFCDGGGSASSSTGSASYSTRTSAPVSVGQTTAVTAASARIRAGPTTGSAVVSGRSKGSLLVVAEIQGDWCRVTTTSGERVGWVYCPLLAPR